MMCFVKILLICSHFLLNLCWLVTHRRGTKNPLAWSTLCSGYVQFRPNASTSQHACITGKKLSPNQHTTHLFYAQPVVEA